MAHPLFAKLQASCELLGWKSWIEEAQSADDIAQMHVLIHVDDQVRNYVVRLLVSGDDAADASSMQLLDLAVILPFRVADGALADTARLLASINLANVIGAFALSEADRVVILRYGWHAVASELQPNRVVRLLDMFDYQCQDSAALIEQVATGAVTFDQIGQAVRELTSAEGVQ
ncbi:hypothetical protein SDC9_122621 [bioreactor metagenome]|uniref:Uncharacterized protein n=1 Tax=bioreactor metagenome TaxID=1076179 RepID=A0A645CF93_9ZZZZ